MGVPIVYRKGNEGAVASYDWYDYAAGVGYKRFYCTGGNESTGKTYFVTDNQLDGAAGNLYTSINNGSVELNFDLLFNQSAKVSGTALINYTQSVDQNSTVSGAFIIYHVNTAAEETSIGTVTGPLLTTAAANAHARECIKCPLTTKSFAAGEKLRVSILFSEAGAGAYGYIWHDPNSRTSVSEGAVSIKSSLIIDIPFKVEL